MELPQPVHVEKIKIYGRNHQSHYGRAENVYIWFKKTGQAWNRFPDPISTSEYIYEYYLMNFEITHLMLEKGRGYAENCEWVEERGRYFGCEYFNYGSNPSYPYTDDDDSYLQFADFEVIIASDGERRRLLLSQTEESSSSTLSSLFSVVPSKKSSVVPSKKVFVSGEETERLLSSETEESPLSLSDGDTRTLENISFVSSDINTSTSYATCDWLGDDDRLCEQFKDYYFNGKNVYSACCVCGGGQHVTVSPSEEPSLSPSLQPSFPPTESQNPSRLPSTVPSILPSENPSEAPSGSPSKSMLPSSHPSVSFAELFNGDTCHYDRECKARPLFPAHVKGEELCLLRQRRIFQQ